MAAFPTKLPPKGATETRYLVKELKDLFRTFEEKKYKQSADFSVPEVTLTEKPVIEVFVTPPPVCKSPTESQTLTLRSSIQTNSSEKVELKQFDPNFFSPQSIWCRYPGCKRHRPRDPKSIKEDLYLCAFHRKSLEAHVAKMCAEKGVDVPRKNLCRKDLKGYTSIIGLLESAYHSLTMITPLGSPLSSGSKERKEIAILLQEVFLNMRNYLIIVNALLNDDEENIETAVTEPTNIQGAILRRISQITLPELRELVRLLKEVIYFILFCFGIQYAWVFLALTNNPGAQLGAGVGGAIGLLGFVTGPVFGVVIAAGGAIFGGLIGSGLFNTWKYLRGEDDETRRHREFIRRQEEAADHQPQGMPDEQQPADEERAVYFGTGSAAGDLSLRIVERYMLRADVNL